MNYYKSLGNSQTIYGKKTAQTQLVLGMQNESQYQLLTPSIQKLFQSLKNTQTSLVPLRKQKSLSVEKLGTIKQPSTPKFSQGTKLDSFFTQLQEEIHNELRSSSRPAKFTQSTLFQSVHSNYDNLSSIRDISPVSKLLRPTFCSTAKYSPRVHLSTPLFKNRSSSVPMNIIKPHKISKELVSRMEKDALNSDEKLEVKRRLRRIVKEKKQLIANKAFEKLCSMNQYKLFDEEVNEIRADSFYRYEMTKLRTTTIPKLVNIAAEEVKTQRDSPRDNLCSIPYDSDIKKTEEVTKLNTLLIRKRKSILQRISRKLPEPEKQQLMRNISERIKYNATEGLKNRSVSPVFAVYPQLNISKKQVLKSLNY